MSMKLHILPISPHCRKVMALVKHLGLPVEMVIKESGFSSDPEFLTMNPNGKVPTLEDGDTYVWESNIILRYIAEQLGSKLWPADSKMQRDVSCWQTWEAAHYSQAVLGVFYQRVIKSMFDLGKPDEAVVEEKLEHTERFSKVLDGQLRKNDFVVGDSLSIADFSIGAIAVTTEMSKIDMSSYKNISTWLERLSHLKGWDEIIPTTETTLLVAA